MNNIKFTQELKDYELKYWNAHKHEKNTRAPIMKSLFIDENVEGTVAADIGCGPRCGVFNELNFSVMYAVDPLWPEYKRDKIIREVPGVTLLTNTAESFTLSEKADVIFSFNALDHSGSLEKSFHNIMSNLSEDGKFYFHIHLRTKPQLNFGHRMLITEKDIDNILKPYTILSKKVLDTCPLDKKKYRSYISIVTL